ncbi:hypothetical protein HY798_04215 [Candidatus Falkowbacteria bacterium]|nr:hypothetical protein [Candidatus Falkowbacteria bacterium]
MISEKRRLFIALNIPADLKNELKGLIDILQEKSVGVNPVRNFNSSSVKLNVKSIKYNSTTKESQSIISNGIKWVRPNGFHITLHFLGYLDSNIFKIPADERRLGLPIARIIGTRTYYAGNSS